MSFVGKVGQSSVDKGVEKAPLAAARATQANDFKKIFSKEVVSPDEGEQAKNSVQGEAKLAQTSALDVIQDPVSDNTVAPLGLPVASDNGNPLPKLSIYKPGLQVGRVILTTSSPKVNEDSFTAFARAQGINESLLKQPQASIAQASIAQASIAQESIAQDLIQQDSIQQASIAQDSIKQALGPEVAAQQGTTGQALEQNYNAEFAAVTESVAEAAPSILSGLLSTSTLQRNPLQGAAEKLSPEALAGAANPTASADSTLSALRAQHAFGLAKSETKAGDTRVGGGELVNPLASTMIGAHDLRAQRQQTILEGHSGQVNKEFTEKPVDGFGKQIEAKILSEKLSISELRQARQAIDSAMEFARSNVQNGGENLPAPAALESAFAASSTLASPPVSALQGAATSVAPVVASLGAVLSANDPSLMQARMQPYQDWAEKFGEVLGQKLSLAVKQGTWAVKLNLNPHSLGEIAISLEVGEGGIEGQLSANDGAVRQLMSDALPKLRASLEDLFGQSGNVNIEVGDDDASKGKQSSGDLVEIAIDLEDEIFSGNKVMAGSGITLRDGFDVLV